jgi:hypothetical protein
MAPVKLHGDVTRNLIFLICRVSQETYLEVNHLSDLVQSMENRVPAQHVSTTVRKFRQK